MEQPCRLDPRLFRFVSYLIYGPGWVSGYLNLRPDERDESWDNWEPITEEWKRIEPDLKREFLSARSKAVEIVG